MQPLHPARVFSAPMPLVSMAHLLAEAQRGNYAVCYCESWNLESFEAVVEAAEEAQGPVIVGFNGGFLMHPSRSKPENLAYYAGMGRALRDTPAPVALLLNETDNFAQIEQGIALGFNAVMVENDHLPPEEYRRLVKRVVQVSHAAGVAVEAAVGRLPNGWIGGKSQGCITDPMDAQRFVEDTEVDALGVSFGNVHILTSGKAMIDLAALARIHEKVDVPLVMHGGTGVPSELARSIIACGVAKFNFGTVLKQSYLEAVQKKLTAYNNPSNPHLFLGMGGDQDVLIAGREAVKNKVVELLRLCGPPRSG
jgi:ketose-bisphosphate aldolase